MIDLTKYRLPETVEVDGSLYPVHTSFKSWLRFLELVAARNTPPKKFDFMYADAKPPSKLNGVAALLKFCNPPQELPRTQKDGPSDKVVDYSLDSDYIYAAFMENYGIDLVESDMHWYKFLALFKGLHDTKLSEIIGYRLYEPPSGKPNEYTKQMLKLKSAWELPTESDEEDEDLKAFEEKLYRGNTQTDD